MKNIFLALIALVFFSACSVSSFNQNSISSKEELIENSQNGDINAMLQLNEHYKFPETKEGLYYFNKWYKTLDEKDNPKDLTAIAKIYDKYADMFINGNEKAHNLYKLSAKLGDNDANIALIISYLKSYKREEAKALQEKVIDSFTQEQVQELYSFYSKNYFSRQTKDIEEYMNKKGYELPSDIIIQEIRKNSYRAKDNKKENLLINTLLKRNNSEDIYKLGNLYYKKYQFEKAIPFYEKSLELNPENEKALLELGAIYSRGNYREKLEKDTIKAHNYLLKASKLGNEEASLKLLESYSKDEKYLDKYFALKEELLKTAENKITLAKFYKKKRQETKAYELLKELAEEGNHEAIIELATIKISRYNFVPETFKESKKWKDYIETSKDSELKNKYIKKISDPYMKRHFKEEYEKYSKNEIETNNIFDLRELYRVNKYRNKELALKAINKAVEYGDVKSTYDLISFYKSDRDHKDFNKVVKLLEGLEQRGENKAAEQLAQLYFSPPYGFDKFKDEEKAIKLYEKLAEEGNYQASRKLVDIYLCGRCEGNRINHKKAKYYLEKLEPRGYSYDLANLGWVNQYGEGIKRDLYKAKEYYEKAAKKGYRTAYYYLTWLYYQDDESPKDTMIKLDYKKALEYLHEGHKQKDFRATNLIGVFYEKGFGVKKDREKAVSYYKLAAKYDMFAANHLAEYYYDKKDYQKAFDLYKFADEKGHKAATVKLGIMYEKGNLGKVDIEKALNYYAKAYKKYDDKVAAYNIGLIFHYGKGGMKKDKKVAKEWYEKSGTKKAKNQAKLLK